MELLVLILGSLILFLFGLFFLNSAFHAAKVQFTLYMIERDVRKTNESIFDRF